MKTTLTPAIVQIEAKELSEFQPVNETLAKDFLPFWPKARDKKFGVVDLWNCRKMRRMHGIKIR